ncbi:MAG: adenylosuccinate lyase, partial [Acidobacteriota bacterium]|nr:adenylosuccinate lyase [Acidobacteriota bacterium]
VFSQSVLLALTQKGLTREKAYELVQRNSLAAWTKKLSFKDLAAADPEIAALLPGAELEKCFSLGPYLDKTDYIFKRVFSHEG